MFDTVVFALQISSRILNDTTTAHVINFGSQHFAIMSTYDGPKIDMPTALRGMIVNTILEDENHIQEAVASLDTLEHLKESGVYVCQCNKQYKRRENFSNHIKDTGHVIFLIVMTV